MTASLLLRALVAALEIEAEVLKKATPEQVQALLERHEARVEKFRAALDRLGFWTAPGEAADV